MKYYSLNNPKHFTTFEDAVFRGLAPDKGLYFPSEIKKLPDSFFDNISSLTPEEIALEVISSYTGDEIPKEDLREIIQKSLNFDLPVVRLMEHINVLELFHGPTLAFKDVGARFMAGVLGYFIQKGNSGRLTVLVATSGDTGGAVANGFLGVEGIEVVILYPSGKVSGIQEKQLTTSGENVTAMEVNGSFDQCQEMVKRAFLDEEVRSSNKLTSANSINVARWMPQMFYYFIAYQQLVSSKDKLVFSVPSGNFGNICAGLLAKKMGLPVDHFIASNNSNDTVNRFLHSGQYEPHQAVETISNAMDVAEPSNFVRILELFGEDLDELKKKMSSYSFSDDQTRDAIKEVFEQTGYIMDPHGAVGYLGLKAFLKENQGYEGVFLETAHPVKFPETVEAVIGKKIDVPSSVSSLKDKKKRSVKINDYQELKEFLLRS